jgi:hypothetical protein
MLPRDNRRLKLLYGPENYMEYALMVMQGFYHSSMRNMLQLNNRNGTFSETGQLAGVSNTDWSWAPPFADFDNDGWKDLFVTNGYFRDYTDRDFLKIKYDYYAQQARAREPADTFYISGLMKSTPVHNFIFNNNKDLTFTDKSLTWGFEKKGFSNGAAYSDLDNDGDLDLVVSNQNDFATIYQNRMRESGRAANYIRVKLKGDGKNTDGICSKVYVYSRLGPQFQEQMPTRGYQSCVSRTLFFGLADVDNADSVIVEWPLGKVSILKNIKANQLIEINEADAKNVVIKPVPEPKIFSPVISPITYQHTEAGFNDFSRQPLLTYMPSLCSPVMASADVNGDGLDDVYVGGTKENPGMLYFQTPGGSFTASSDFVYAADYFCTDADALFFDADGDDDKDLYVVSGGYHDYGRNNKGLQDRLYLNNGAGRFTRTENNLPPILISKSCVAASDIDRDGDSDLFVGGRMMPGEYPKPQESFLLLNDGSGLFTNVAPSFLPDLAAGGMITDAEWIDLNNDTWPDLVTAGEFMPIRVFHNNQGKGFSETTNSYFETAEGGFWNRIAAADIDNDGDMDLVAGNFGTNSQIKASINEPVEMTFNDFDNNGTVDPILTYYIQGVSYPFPSRNELLTQLNSLRRKFPDYESYSTARLSDIFSPEELQSAAVLTATELKTIIFINSSGRFEKKYLPIEAQFAPVHAIEIFDYNKDGNKDLILGGNRNAMCVRLGVMDANYGQLFQGDGKGNFKYIPQIESGLKIIGDVRSFRTMTINGSLYLFAGVSNFGVAAYVLNSK